MPDEQRKLAAIMFTDMVGFSARTQTNEALALSLLTKQNELLHPLILKFGGVEIKKTGDGFFVEFSSALEAVQCAIDMQKILTEYNSSSQADHRFNIRIGIHVGDVVHREKDVIGDGVNIAARVEPIAKPGGICITEDVYRQVQNKGEVIDVIRLGKGAMKNIHSPITIYQVILPWEKKHLPLIAKINFSFQKTRTKISFAVLLIALLAGIAMWKTKNMYARSSLDRSIAVLPFKNLSEEKENEYFSDGITEDIIAQLSKIGALKVISRTSAMQYKTSTKSILQIGNELDVATVLEGSVRREGNKIRVVAELIDARTDEHLWTETYDRAMTEIFAIQSDVAQEIASALQTKLTTSEKGRIENPATGNLEAYNLFLKGRYYWNVRTEESMAKSVDYFKQAIALDSTYVAAYAGLAAAYIVLGDWGVIPSPIAYPNAKAAALKGLSLDSLNGEAQTALAMIRFDYDWDWSGAYKEFKRAIALDPGYATAHQWFAEYLVVVGRSEEAIAEIQKAKQLDPLSLIISSIESYVYYYAYQYDNAIESAKRTLAINPNYYPAHLYLFFSYRQKKMNDEALQERLAMVTDEGGREEDQTALRNAYAQGGMDGLHRWEIIFQNKRTRWKYVDPYIYSITYTALLDKEKAFAFLNKDIENHSRYVVFFKASPDLQFLHSDKRFDEVLKNVGFDRPLNF